MRSRKRGQGSGLGDFGGSGLFDFGSQVFDKAPALPETGYRRKKAASIFQRGAVLVCSHSPDCGLAPACTAAGSRGCFRLLDAGRHFSDPAQPYLRKKAWQALASTSPGGFSGNLCLSGFSCFLSGQRDMRLSQHRIRFATKIMNM